MVDVADIELICVARRPPSVGGKPRVSTPCVDCFTDLKYRTWRTAHPTFVEDATVEPFPDHVPWPPASGLRPLWPQSIHFEVPHTNGVSSLERCFQPRHITSETSIQIRRTLFPRQPSLCGSDAMHLLHTSLAADLGSRGTRPEGPVSTPQ